MTDLQNLISLILGFSSVLASIRLLIGLENIKILIRSLYRFNNTEFHFKVILSRIPDHTGLKAAILLLAQSERAGTYLRNKTSVKICCKHDIYSFGRATYYEGLVATEEHLLSIIYYTWKEIFETPY